MTKAYEKQSQSGKIRLNANEYSKNLSEQMLQKIADVLPSVEFNRYPDAEETELLEAYGKKINIDPARLLAGNGSDQMLGYLITTYLGKGKKLLTLDPDFSMYVYYAGSIDTEVLYYPQTNGRGYSVSEMIKYIDQTKPDMVLFSNPNNPTGFCLSKTEIEKLIKAFPETIIVADEAYIEFADEESSISLTDQYENFFVTRTLSKAYGLAGLRVGFLIGNETPMTELKQNFVPYALNALSMKIASMVLDECNIDDRISLIKTERTRMFDALSTMKKITVYPSQANFLYGSCADLPELLGAFQHAGITIRSYRETNNFRITIGLKEENDAVLNVLNQFEEA